MNHLLRKVVYLAICVAACAYALVAFRGPNGVPALMEKRRQITAMQEQNATLAADNQRKRERIEKLDKDRAVQELEIRKRLKLLHPGETQFILPDRSPQRSSSSTCWYSLSIVSSDFASVANRSSGSVLDERTWIQRSGQISFRPSVLSIVRPGSSLPTAASAYRVGRARRRRFPILR